MSVRKLVYTLCGAVLFAALATFPASAMGDSHRTYFTFNQPVSLPGVALPAGTYVFEVPDTLAWNLVRVTNRRGTQVYLTAFTRIVERPANRNLDAAIVLGEAVSSAPQPIKVWYPQGERTGREFIY